MYLVKQNQSVIDLEDADAFVTCSECGNWLKTDIDTLLQFFLDCITMTCPECHDKRGGSQCHSE